MNIQISLAEDGPPFWFLGDPKYLIVTLTYHEPGPTTVDFSKLGNKEQKQILVAMQMEHITVDRSFVELEQEYEKFFPANTPDKASGGEAPGRTGMDRALKMEAGRQEKEAKFQAKCQLLSKQKISILKSAINKEEDLRILRTLRDMELAKKKSRPAVLTALDLKLRKIQANLVEEIEKSAITEIEAELPPEKETFVSDVIELEKEIVHLTPEILAQLANGSPLGGE